ncbi:ubiquinol-cytochrome c reductase iron-sulfur subunit [Oculatella sp. LEGE 06141]|uniref:QcrA and Rieske domain-containing protein n=1 Tax=Oculatella sp. LEGE 06141 TaxID=1828648 RepID=UPI00188268F8|nr:ubiquinol-cytochrome c reductase iron-sulfur subunit [Oculatella sp. LEGE 06141]MBE9179140.1 ubiquinol-cytochrome c reductase iron-sulfur subunit [Oculatella sp. LEGE 06141]
MDRRTFMNWVGVGCLAQFFPVAIAACTPQSSETATSTDEFRDVGDVAQLDQDGQLLDEQTAGSPLLVVRDTSQPDTLVAINPICTHRDCLVEWQPDRNVFLCNCHDSAFDTAGQVLSPPASKPLAVHDVKVEGDRVLVKTVATRT